MATEPAGGPLKESMARSGAVSLGGSAFAALAALALTAVISRSYGTSGTGVFFQAVAIFTIATGVLKLGTNSALIRFISARRALTGETGAWRTTLIAVVPVLVVASLVSLALVAFSAPLAGILSGGTDSAPLAALLRLMAPFIVVGAVLGVLQTVARLVRGVTAFTVLQSIGPPLSRLVVALALITLASGADVAFLGWMAVLPVWLVITALAIVAPLLRDRSRQRSSAHPPVSPREFWRFSAPRAVGASLETALDWSDVIIVAALTSPAEAGIYAVVTRVVRAGQVIDRAMRIAVSPRISHVLALGDHDGATDLHTSVTRVLILLSWPFYLALAILGPTILSIFGDGFAAGAPALTILALAMMVSSASGMLQSVLLQGGRSSWQMYNKAAVLALNIGLSILLVPVLGITGAATSWLACLLLDTALAAWQVHRTLGVRLEPRALAPAALLTLAVFGGGCAIIRVLAGDSFVGTLVGGAVLVAVYAGLVTAGYTVTSRRRARLASVGSVAAPADEQLQRTDESPASRRDR